jgi:hypothetical protein
LARARFAAGEPEQGCVDGDQALARLNGSVSTMATARLRELAANTTPYRMHGPVQEFRERLCRALVE